MTRTRGVSAPHVPCGNLALGYVYEKARMKVTPPLAAALIAQEDDMRWNPNNDGIVFNR